MFSVPLCLTIGDGSTNYQTFSKFRFIFNPETIGREPEKVGGSPRMKVLQKSPGHFERLKSNAINNPYVDAGQYDLRKPGPRGAGTGSMNATMRGTGFKTPFI